MLPDVDIDGGVVMDPLLGNFIKTEYRRPERGEYYLCSDGKVGKAQQQRAKEHQILEPLDEDI